MTCKVNNWKIFKDTVYTLSTAQGYYSRLRQRIEDMTMDELAELENKINNLDIEFKEPVDVILFLEG